MARRVRELDAYCEICPFNHLPEDIDSFTAVILPGSPYSVHSAEALHPDLSAVKDKKSLLAVCYGVQYLVHFDGGEVTPSNIREYRRAHLSYINPTNDHLFKDISQDSQVWMNHSDTIKQLPERSIHLANTADIANATYHIEDEDTYAIQFHPEISHSIDGTKLLNNFLLKVAHTTPNWIPDNFVEMTVANLREQVGDEEVVLSLSGGVDSAAAAVLLHRAIGSQLHCIFVNNGLLRKGEFANILEQCEGMGLNIKGVNASERFLSALAGKTDPKEERKIIGHVFIEVFDDEVHKITDAKWLGQGTIYLNVIKSLSVKGPSTTIKSHRSVGGLPDYMKLKIVEPLRVLFRGEMRRVGRTLGIDPKLLGRHPFPGPGLAIRVLGDIIPEKVAVLQEVDTIFIDVLREEKLYDKVWQAGAILLPIDSIGVMGDERTYEKVVALHAVENVGGMTTDWVDLPYEFLQKVSNTIINRVKGVNRVMYDISSKSFATIGWE